MNVLDLLQWPAMLATIGAAWLIGSTRPRWRHGGFWLFLVSNALWIGWGWPAQAYGLIVLQVFLVGTNVRGLHETWPSGQNARSSGLNAAQAAAGPDDQPR